MDAFLMQAEKSNQNQQLHSQGSTWGGRQESNYAYNWSTHYSPYDKDSNQPKLNDSFHEGRKPTLCLHCGAVGHRPVTAML